MMLDADDLVSNRLVDYVLKDGDPNGYLVESGYAYDWKANLIAPIPGVWGKGFDNVCGSCSVINFAPDDLPPLRGGDESVDYLAKHLKQHSHWKHVMREAGRPLKSLPFPAAVYVLNHDNNLHYALKQNRQDTIPRKIRGRQVPLSPAMIEEFFSPEAIDLLAVPTVSSPKPSTPLAAPTESSPKPSTPLAAPTESSPKPSTPLAAPTESSPKPSTPLAAPTASPTGRSRIKNRFFSDCAKRTPEPCP